MPISGKRLQVPTRSNASPKVSGYARLRSGDCMSISGPGTSTVSRIPPVAVCSPVTTVSVQAGYSNRKWRECTFQATLTLATPSLARPQAHLPLATHTQWCSAGLLHKMSCLQHSKRAFPSEECASARHNLHHHWRKVPYQCCFAGPAWCLPKLPTDEVPRSASARSSQRAEVFAWTKPAQPNTSEINTMQLRRPKQGVMKKVTHLTILKRSSRTPPWVTTRTR